MKKYKLIIAGSRTLEFYPQSLHAIIMQTPFYAKIKEIVSGCAKGVDKSGEEYAKSLSIKIKPFPANWDMYGKKAGIVRNIQMADYADALLAIWDGESKGTMHMINLAREKKLKVYVQTMIPTSKKI